MMVMFMMDSWIIRRGYDRNVDNRNGSQSCAITLVKIDCTVQPLVKSERPLLVVDFPLQCDDDARDFWGLAIGNVAHLKICLKYSVFIWNIWVFQCPGSISFFGWSATIPPASQASAGVEILRSARNLIWSKCQDLPRFILSKPYLHPTNLLSRSYPSLIATPCTFHSGSHHYVQKYHS